MVAAALLLTLAPTFYGEVLPVLQRRCLGCHRAGEIGPMPLGTHAQARPWAKAIRQAVLSKKMPPWFAAESSQPLAGDPRLTPEEIQTIEAWAAGGAPAGDAKRAPPAAVTYTEGWNIPRPDMTVRMPEAVRVPAREELDYQYVILPLGLAEDRWVRAAEVRPGARGVVHHAVVYVREPGSAWLRDAPAGRPFVRPGVTRSDILAIYAPGQPAMECREGMAKRIPAGSDLVLQMHYTPNGRMVEDRTTIGLVFASEPPQNRVLTLQLGTVDFRIPAGERNQRVSVTGTLPNDALLLSFFPHMHLRGKAFEYAIAGPGGQRETLLRVAPYDFSWQLNYVLATPRALKKGTRLVCTAWYDNSPGNPRNPDPLADVGYGEQSRDEMMVGFFDVAVPADVDKAQYFVR